MAWKFNGWSRREDLRWGHPDWISTAAGLHEDALDLCEELANLLERGMQEDPTYGEMWSGDVEKALDKCRVKEDKWMSMKDVKRHVRDILSRLEKLER